MTKKAAAAFDRAPETIKLYVCPVCGRNDYVMMMKAKHFSGGEKCPGEPVFVTYRKEGGAAA